MSEQFDIIIIGTGAGGGTMARALAPTGKRILVLEKGGFIPRERQNSDSQAVWVDKRYSSGETWVHDGKPFEPAHPHICVGGSTKFYGAALFRLRERDFEEFKHVDGISPAWPISYADLNPYYSQAEKWYYVHGQAGLDPTEPPRDLPYPYAPVPHEKRIQKLSDDLAAQGLHPFPLPIGMRLSRDREEGATSDLNLWPQFDGYPDPFEIKADSHIVGIRPALAHDNVSLRTNSPVQRLETDGGGRKVTGVVVKNGDGSEERLTADTVIVAAGAIGSALLFLRSANDKHPQGLANRTGLVGRNYLGHNNSTLIAISKEPNDATFEKTLAFADYYWGDDEFKYPMGLVQMLGKVDARLMSFEAPEPFEGMTHEQMAAHSLDFWLQVEDLPDPNNRVFYNDEGRVEFDYRPNNLPAVEALTARLRNLLDHIGCHQCLRSLNHYVGGRIAVPLGHEMGTMKMGTDANTSVLDPYCRAHELDNVFVTDGSFMVSAGAVNPTLTIIAQTLRVADYLKQHVL